MNAVDEGNMGSTSSSKVGYLGQGGGATDNEREPTTRSVFTLLSPTSAADLVMRSRNNSFTEDTADGTELGDADIGVRPPKTSSSPGRGVVTAERNEPADDCAGAGAGGMSTVRSSHDTDSGRPVPPPKAVHVGGGFFSNFGFGGGGGDGGSSSNSNSNPNSIHNIYSSVPSNTYGCDSGPVASRYSQPSNNNNSISGNIHTDSRLNPRTVEPSPVSIGGGDVEAPVLMTTKSKDADAGTAQVAPFDVEGKAGDGDGDGDGDGAADKDKGVDEDDGSSIPVWKRPRFMAIIGVMVAIVLGFTTAFMMGTGGPDWRTIQVDGKSRKYLYHGPERGQGKNQALVAVLHGFMADAPGLQSQTRFDEVADKHGFAVVYPQGSEDAKGRTFYNVGYKQHSAETVDDTRFIMDLMLYLAGENKLGMDKLFVTGFSNGGDIIYQMACMYPHILAGVAPVAGMMLDSVTASQSCKTPNRFQQSRSLPIYAIGGSADDVTYWGGDSYGGPWGPYPAQTVTHEWWATRQKCAKKTGPDPSTLNGKTVRKYKAEGCEDGSEASAAVLELVEVVGYGHGWGLAGGDLETSEAVWNFFQSYVKT